MTARQRCADHVRLLGLHDHVGLVYDSAEEQFAVVVPYIAAGLASGQQGLFIASDREPAEVEGLLRAGGIDVDAAIRSGALTILRAEDAYLREGCFDPERMIGLVKEKVAAAKQAGFSGLRATGEMNWALRGAPGSHRLAEYEAGIDAIMRDLDLVALCQYDRNRFSPGLLRDVIRTHPKLIIGGTVCDNALHVPADELLQPDQQAREVYRLLSNILERQRVAGDLRTARFAMDSAGDSVFLVDQDGRFLYVNDTACRSLGYVREDLVAMSVWDVDPDFTRDRWTAHWAELKRVGVLTFESRNRRKDGTIFPIEVCANYFAHDGMEYNCAFTRDVTARKQAEEAMALYRDHLEELVEQRSRELDAAREQARRAERLASLGTLAAGIAHEINNPIGMIVLAAENALAMAGEPDAARVVERALRNIIDDAERCGGIVKSMLQFARQEPTDKWPNSVNEIAERMVRAMRHDARSRRVTIEPQLEPDVPLVAMNPIEIGQVLMNLIQNAIEAAPSGSRVTVRTRRDGDFVSLAVEDQGRGMSEGELRHVFEPFFSTRRTEGGSGLGLSIVHGIVTNHAGKIDVRSASGQGTTVLVRLPVGRQPSEETTDV
jgi:PAS domain S-box-containing protein